MGGFGLGMIWLRHYLCKSAGGRIAAIIIGVMAAVPVGNLAAGVFLRYFENLRYQSADAIMLFFIGGCIAICVSLLSPPDNTPPTSGGTTMPTPGGYP
jgi:hypothetical protein